MCSCFYLRLVAQLLGGLGVRIADEVSDMIVKFKRGLSRCCYTLPPEPPGIPNSIHQFFFKQESIFMEKISEILNQNPQNDLKNNANCITKN